MPRAQVSEIIEVLGATGRLLVPNQVLPTQEAVACAHVLGVQALNPPAKLTRHGASFAGRHASLRFDVPCRRLEPAGLVHRSLHGGILTAVEPPGKAAEWSGWSAHSGKAPGASASARTASPTPAWCAEEKQAVTFIRGLPATACAASFRRLLRGVGRAVDDH